MPKFTATQLQLDYFKFYDVKDRPVTSDPTAVVKGQFDTSQRTVRLRLLDFFANPVSKNGEPMFNKNAHLTWYRGVEPPEPARKVVLANQFHPNKLEIRIGNAAGLLVPTQKLEPGSQYPEKLDHYRVYRLLEPVPVPPKVVKLKDQFFGEEVKLVAAQFFAVPVTKRHANKIFSINNKTAHLLIYSISSNEFEKNVRIRNQFDPNGAGLNVQRTILLAAPSIKLAWKPL